MNEYNIAIKSPNQDSSPALSPTMYSQLLAAAQGVKQLGCRATRGTEDGPRTRCPLYRARCVKEVVPGAVAFDQPSHEHQALLALLPEVTSSFWSPAQPAWSPSLCGSWFFGFKGMAAVRRPVQYWLQAPFTKLNMLKASPSTSAS